MINKKIFNNLQNTFGYEITGSTDTTNQCRFFPIGRGHEGKGYVACADSNIVFKAQPNTCRTNTSSKMPELSGIGSYTYNGTRCHLVPVK